MPVKTYWESEGFVMEASGILTADEIIAASDTFGKLPEGTNTKYQIINALEVEDIYVCELELVNIVADDLSMSRRFPFLKIALLAKEGPVMENFCNYVKISWNLNTSWDIRIFSSLEAAQNWLEYKTA